MFVAWCIKTDEDRGILHGLEYLWKAFLFGGDYILKVVPGAGSTRSYCTLLHCPNTATWELLGLAFHSASRESLL